MTETENILNQYKVILESRLTKVETQHYNMFEDLKEIKRSIHWLTGLVLSVNTAVLGIIIKGFGLLG